MVVHAYRVRCASEQRLLPMRVPLPAPPTVRSVLPQRLQTVLQQHPEVLHGEAQPVADAPGGALVAAFRVSGDEDADEVASTIVRDALDDLAWYTVHHHACRHDEGRPCGPWTLVRTYGTVPPEEESE